MHSRPKPIRKAVRCSFVVPATVVLAAAGLASGVAAQTIQQKDLIGRWKEAGGDTNSMNVLSLNADSTITFDRVKHDSIVDRDAGRWSSSDSVLWVHLNSNGHADSVRIVTLQGRRLVIKEGNKGEMTFERLDP